MQISSTQILSYAEYEGWELGERGGAPAVLGVGQEEGSQARGEEEDGEKKRPEA